jgi:hypothetical protein
MISKFEGSFSSSAMLRLSNLWETESSCVVSIQVAKISFLTCSSAPDMWNSMTRECEEISSYQHLLFNISFYLDMR